MFFRLRKKCGNHIGPPDANGNRKTYKAGNVVPSEDDLVAKFPMKFELVQGQTEDDNEIASVPNIPEPIKSKKTKTTVAKSNTQKSSKVIKSKYGEDVTEQFPLAKELDLQVFEKSKWFTVVDDDVEVNDKKLRRKEVDSFLEDYSQIDDEDDEDSEDEEDEEEVKNKKNKKNRRKVKSKRKEETNEDDEDIDDYEEEDEDDDEE